MYKYDYVRTGTSFGGWDQTDYKDIIRSMAAEGWRFVTAIPVKQTGNGLIKEMELIFEKEFEEDRPSEDE